MTTPNLDRNHRDDLEAIYLEYFNDYLTVERMAEHKGQTVEQMRATIQMGREIHLDKHRA